MARTGKGCGWVSKWCRLGAGGVGADLEPVVARGLVHLHVLDERRVLLLEALDPLRAVARASVHGQERHLLRQGLDAALHGDEMAQGGRERKRENGKKRASTGGKGEDTKNNSGE